MARIAVIGNAGGGKSTLARRLAARRDLPYCEIDRLLWRPGWRLAPAADYEAEHERLIAGERWLIDGLGRRESLARRLERASEIMLVDLPLWTHFWLAAERQIAWARGAPTERPGEIEEMPPTEALFRTIWQVDQDWLPELRETVRRREAAGAAVTRIESVEALSEMQRAIGLNQRRKGDENPGDC